MIAACLLALAQGDGNRLWWLEVEPTGAAEVLELDCGADGMTRVLGPFLAGEGRRLRVPVPVRSPLGREGLGLVPLPAVVAGNARVVGWSAEQPDEALVRTARGLLARARPPAGAGSVRAGGPEVWLVLLLLPLLLYLRRRFLAFVLVALAGGVFVFARTRSLGAEGEPVAILEFDLAAGVGLSVSAARAELELPGTRLEARPDGTAIALEVSAGGTRVKARAPGAILYALEPVAAVAVSAEHLPALAAAWVRSPAGEWSARGPWPAGAPLGPAVEGGGSPPGWLTGALPPGVGLLVGRTSGGTWLRASSFELSEEDPEDGY